MEDWPTRSNMRVEGVRTRAVAWTNAYVANVIEAAGSDTRVTESSCA